GAPDLAVGNDGDRDQVFANLNSTPGTPRMIWLWTSQKALQTTGLAWGDVDGDGDLDLAASHITNGEASGYYLNGTIVASHVGGNFLSRMPLPNNPTYVSVERPGETSDAYLYSSSEILA